MVLWLSIHVWPKCLIQQSSPLERQVELASMFTLCLHLHDSFLLFVIKAGKAVLVSLYQYSKHMLHFSHRHIGFDFFSLPPPPIFWKGNGSRSGTPRALRSSALGVECYCTCPFCWLREVSCPYFCGERFLIL